MFKYTGLTAQHQHALKVSCTGHETKMREIIVTILSGVSKILASQHEFRVQYHPAIPWHESEQDRCNIFFKVPQTAVL